MAEQRPGGFDPSGGPDDSVARSLGFPSADAYATFQKDKAQLTERLAQLLEENPPEHADGNSNLFNTVVAAAVSFWERVGARSAMIQEIPRLLLGEEHIAFLWWTNAPNNRFEIWIHLDGTATYTLYLNGSQVSFGKHHPLNQGSNVLTEMYFKAAFRHQIHD